MRRGFRVIKAIVLALVLVGIAYVVLAAKAEKNVSNAPITVGKEEDKSVVVVEDKQKDNDKGSNDAASPKSTDLDSKENKDSADKVAGDKDIGADPKKDEVKNFYKLNDKGDKVQEIQKSLNKFGYKLAVDGVFGNSTKFAVMNFQQKVGLTADGVVGDQTIKKLNQEPTEELMYKPKTEDNNKALLGSAPKENPSQDGSAQENFINSQGVSSPTNYYIWVDTSNFRVNIFTGSTNNWKLHKSMKASIGAPSTPTIKGKFSIGSRGSMFRVNNNTICKYFTQFKGNYLFHSVLLDNNGKVKDGRLGMRISHGCIRLAVEDAKYIYENIPSTTSVWVK